MEAVVQGLRTRDFPCDVLNIDPYWMGEGPWCTYQFDTEVFPDPEEMLANLRAQGVRTCLWINPYVPEGSVVYEAAQEGNLRYRLLPYIYTEAVEASASSVPMVRPLVLEYPEDPNTEQIDLQYLFESAFLVAPVFSTDLPRRVYLPAGEWIDYWTKEMVFGGRWIKVAVPLEILPLWVKVGAILPLGPEMDYVDQKPLDPLTLELYAPREAGEMIVREEAGLDIPVRYVRQDRTLRVEFGPAPGRVELVLYGLHVRQAQVAGKEWALAPCPGGHLVSLDGRDGGQVVLR